MTHYTHWRSDYGLTPEAFNLSLSVERDGRVTDQTSIDIRTLPDRPDILARMPDQWRQRFLRDAGEARA